MSPKESLHANHRIRSHAFEVRSSLVVVPLCEQIAADRSLEQAVLVLVAELVDGAQLYARSPESPDALVQDILKAASRARENVHVVKLGVADGPKVLPQAFVSKHTIRVPRETQGLLNVFALLLGPKSRERLRRGHRAHRNIIPKTQPRRIVVVRPTTMSWI